MNDTQFVSIEEARTIKPGDLVAVERGPLASNTAIVLEVLQESTNTFAPTSGWLGGPAVRFKTDLGRVDHYQLRLTPVVQKGWLSPSEVLVALKEVAK